MILMGTGEFNLGGNLVIDHHLNQGGGGWSKITSSDHMLLIETRMNFGIMALLSAPSCIGTKKNNFFSLCTI